MHNIQLVQIQPEERLAATSELNLASSMVTGCGEARGMGYWAATQVKGFSHEISIVPEADVVLLTEGCTLIADSPNGTWQGDASPAGSETVARYQMDIMETRETQGVLLSGVSPIKPINGKIVQTTLWESDQFIVPEKQGNACRGKGLAGARWTGRDTPSIPRDGREVSTKLWSITLRAREDPTCKFTSLAHLLTTDFLKECFRELKKDKAPGIDGVTWRKYEENLDENIEDLVTRLIAKQYRPQPVKRAYIPKSNGERRPLLGIPALEDKIVQLAIKKILEVELDPEMRHQMMDALHKSINRAQKLIVAGKRNQDMLFETFPQAKEKTILIPLGVELPKNSEPHASSNKIVYVGRITRYKGIHCIIKAFQEVSRVFPEVELHIYGQISTGLGDYHQELLSLLRKIGIKKINYVPKWFSEEEKIRMIQEAGVVVYPSIGSEGFGIGPLEGLGINGVVVASDVFEETGVINQEVAFVYPSPSIQELTQQLIKAMSLSPEDKALQREKASRWVAILPGKGMLMPLKKYLKVSGAGKMFNGNLNFTKKKKEDMSPAKPPYFLSLGFITHDLAKGNKEIIGGASAYSAILARNFGLDSAIVTSIGQDFQDFDSLKGVWLAYQTGKRTTTFINKTFKKSFIKSASQKGRENISEGRVQYVTGVAERIREETIPEDWFSAEIVYICPVLGELEEEIIKRFEGSMIGVAPQGWLRSVGEGGRIEKKRWEKANDVLSRVDFVIASEEDVFEEDVPRYVDLSNIFVLTRGSKGAELYWDKGKRHEHIPAFESEEVDATGAGDMFGAAFLLRYYETKDVHKAAVFASCAASFVVEKEGVEGVPCREEVEKRMEKEGRDFLSIK